MGNVGCCEKLTSLSGCAHVVVTCAECFQALNLIRCGYLGLQMFYLCLFYLFKVFCKIMQVKMIFYRYVILSKCSQ